MWIEGNYADAEVVTSTGLIKVHKCIVCSRPQFEAAFGGGYSESRSGQMKILDCSHSTVEAFLQFIYIKQLPDRVCYEELIHLAHRFEERDLVKQCARMIAEKADATNVCAAASCLRVLKDEAEVAPSWEKLCRKVSSSRSIQEVLLVTVGNGSGRIDLT